MRIASYAKRLTVRLTNRRSTMSLKQSKMRSIKRLTTLKSIEPAALEEPVSVGAVKDLFVSVCVPVRVATVESMFSVIVSVALATESNPVPPATVSVFPFVIDCVVPESPAAEKDDIPEPVARTSVVPK